MNCQQALVQIDAYLDSELDAAHSLAIEQHIRDCPSCRDQWQQLRALRGAVREKAPYYPAPAALHEHALKLLGDTGAPTPQARLPWRAALGSVSSPTSPRVVRIPAYWPSMAASVLVAAMVGASVTYWMVRPSASGQLAGDVVTSHVRSMMVANRLTDISSSDQHTVKPWFSGKIDFAPNVVDLTAHGFPLVGGRLDYVAQRPVAALVYRHRQHTINLFVWPDPSAGNRAAHRTSRQGYHIARWSQAGMNYWAVSDLNPESLETFSRLVQVQASPASH